MDLANASGQLSLFFIFLLSGRLIFAFKHFNIASYTLLRGSLIGAILSIVGGILLWTPLLALSAFFMSIFFPCILDVFTLFGGTTLIVPANWKVQIDAVSILGGLNDKRRVAASELDQSKVLVIKGVVMLGGIDIKSF